ncbi:MAG: hypothetical protein LBD04_02825 [Synergistaceae bacterium]|jgi:hypothetical protein|nr:hypothetical protein [Synergistaceae bacterium]
MTRPWETWTESEWLANADQYHNARLTAEAWDALGSLKPRALESARTQLRPWLDRAAYPAAVYEQALWLTTEAGLSALNDYSSVSIGEGSISVAYGRGQKRQNPEWMSPLAWALLNAENAGAPRWSAGRVV